MFLETEVCNHFAKCIWKHVKMMDPDGIVETMKRSILPPVLPNEISFSGMVQST